MWTTNKINQRGHTNSQVLGQCLPSQCISGISCALQDSVDGTLQSQHMQSRGAGSS